MKQVSDVSESPETSAVPCELAYDAAHQRSIVVDWSDWTVIDVTGPESRTFLHNFCTNDVNALQPGQGCEAFVTNIKGRILQHVFLFATADSVSVIAPPGAAESLVPHLTKYLLGLEAEVTERSDELGCLWGCGPELSEKLTTLFGCEIPKTPGEHTTANWRESTLLVGALSISTLPDMVLCGPRDQLGALCDALVAQGVVKADAATFETLRIGGGFPLSGVDIGEENLAQEAGRTERTISFRKGCYLGQEPIARLDAMGHTNREIRGIEFDQGPVPAKDAVLLKASGEDEVGRLTSVAASPRTGGAVALALVRKSAMAPGTSVAVDVEGTRVEGRVFWPDATRAAGDID